jgi:hypothetical protein
MKFVLNCDVAFGNDLLLLLLMLCKFVNDDKNKTWLNVTSSIFIQEQHA